MFESPRWLTTLLRVREHRRDKALQSLAQSLQTANAARDSAESVANAVSSLTKVQQRDGSVGRVDVERLRQLRQTRDELRTELTERHRQQTVADAEVQHSQAAATACQTEVEVLQNLNERHVEENRITQRRRDQRILLETAVSLCNGDASA